MKLSKDIYAALPLWISPSAARVADKVWEVINAEVSVPSFLACWRDLQLNLGFS